MLLAHKAECMYVVTSFFSESKRVAQQSIGIFSIRFRLVRNQLSWTVEYSVHIERSDNVAQETNISKTVELLGEHR